MTTQNDLALVWASTGGLSNPGSAKYATGWVAEKPTYQNFNYVLNNITTNLLALADSGEFAYDATITYAAGAVVMVSNIAYTCISSSLGNTPSASSQFWTKGASYGEDAALLIKENGLHLKDVNVRTTATVWEGSDQTIQSPAPLINFVTSNAASKNWLLGNVSGELVAVDVGTVAVPDDRSVALAETLTHRLYHEGHPPVQTEVAGTIPEVPQNGVLYARRNTNYEIVTSTTVSLAPPPPVVGAGQGWYNLEDGQMYVDVDDGDSSQWVLANPPFLPDYETLTGLAGVDNVSVDGVGSMKLLYNFSGGILETSVPQAGSTLRNVYFAGTTLTVSTAPAGTWISVNTADVAYLDTGWFVRTA